MLRKAVGTGLMSRTRYVALLRGINVGGNNLIKMADLRACFEEAGHRDVVTYIASGNVLFTPASAAAPAALTRSIEALLSLAFNYRATLVLREHKQLREIVRKAPRGFGATPDRYRSDVCFLKEPREVKAALADWPLKEGVDQAWAGPGVVYVSRLEARASQSRLSKITALPVYGRLTIRNWNTTTTLLAMMDE
jgi:uncharacterized protein (DUF1697 family)